jgi:hypothetical protein
MKIAPENGSCWICSRTSAARPSAPFLLCRYRHNRNYANCTNMLSPRSSAEYYRCSSICWSELLDHLPNIILRFPSTPPLAQVGEAI